VVACGVGLLSLGGAFGRVPEDATAFNGRSAALWLITEAVWDDPAEDPTRIAWGRDAMAALKRTWDPANVFRRNQNIRP
jgi:Berberine and berberine like